MAGIGVIGSPVSTEELWYVDVDATASSDGGSNLWKRADTLNTKIGSGTYTDPHNFKGGGPYLTNSGLTEVVISEDINRPRRCDIVVTNRAYNPYSANATERYGPLTNTFREGMEILVLNHSTNTVTFRGFIWDIDKAYDEMTGGTINLTCYDSLQDLFDITLESLISYKVVVRGEVLEGDTERTIAAGRGHHQIAAFLAKYERLATSSGNPRFYHFNLSDVSANLGNNPKHHLSYSPSDGMEAIKIGGFWHIGPRKNLLEQITEIANSDPHTANAQSEHGFVFGMANNILDMGTRTGTSSTDGNWTAWPRVNKKIQDTQQGYSYRMPALRYYQLGSWPNKQPANYGLRLIRPAEEGVQSQTRLDRYDGTNSLFPQKIIQSFSDWERVASDIYTSVTINYSIEGEIEDSEDDQGGAAQQSEVFELIHVWNLKQGNVGGSLRDFSWKAASSPYDDLTIGQEGLLSGDDPINRGKDDQTGTPNAAELFYIDTRNADNATWVEGYEPAGVVQYTSLAATSGGTGPDNGSPARTNIATMLISHINRNPYTADHATDGARDWEDENVWPERNGLIGSSAASTATFVRIRGAWSGATAYFDAGGGGNENEKTKIWTGRPLDFVGKPKVARVNLGDTKPKAIRRAAAAILSRLSKDTRRGNIRLMGDPYYAIDCRVKNLAYNGSTRRATLEPYDMNTTWSSATAVTPLYNLGVRVGDHVSFFGSGNATDTTLTTNYSAANLEDYGVITGFGSGSTFNITTTMTAGNTSVVDRDYMRIYVPIRAGMSVRVQDYLHNVNGDFLVEKITYSQRPGQKEVELVLYGDVDTDSVDVISPSERSALARLSHHAHSGSTHQGYETSRPDARKTSYRYTGEFTQGTV